MPQPDPKPEMVARYQVIAPERPGWLTIGIIHPETGRLPAAFSDEEDTALNGFLRTQPTGTDAWRRAPFASWMLAIARVYGEWVLAAAIRPLRAFAHACAFGAGVPIADVLEPPPTSFDAGAAARCDPAALARLAAFHAADWDACQAAFWAAEFAARRSAYLSLDGLAAKWRCADPVHRHLDPAWHLAHFVHHHAPAFATRLAQARARQAVPLRSALPDPFGDPNIHFRTQVFFETRTDHRQRVYCLTCATGLGGMSPGVLLDGRWRACNGCGAPLLTRFPRDQR